MLTKRALISLIQIHQQYNLKDQSFYRELVDIRALKYFDFPQILAMKTGMKKTSPLFLY
jgi:hypothetical protein